MKQKNKSAMHGYADIHQQRLTTNEYEGRCTECNKDISTTMGLQYGMCMKCYRNTNERIQNER